MKKNRASFRSQETENKLKVTGIKAYGDNNKTNTKENCRE